MLMPLDDEALWVIGHNVSAVWVNCVLVEKLLQTISGHNLMLHGSMVVTRVGAGACYYLP